ncbi:MAG: zinc ribbon domain-containing protein [Planctomycetes bacterium]|nr:zinc ribbon domain-containing protein [Planctomycetota bacterium]
MVQRCPRCARINPAEGRFCYHDGAALQPLGHPVKVEVGRVQFPVPFIFPSGQVCRDFDQLALACLDDWSAALDLVQSGDLAAFLGALGRADLAQAAREAARFPDRDRGLDQLLARLPTQTLKPPRLQVEPRQVNLGQLRIGQDQHWELHLANQGMRLLYGSVTCLDCVWLALGESPGTGQKLFQCLHETIIPVQVRGQHLRAGNKPLEAQLLVESNGGKATVAVTAEVPIQPFERGVLAGARTPRQIAEKAKAAPREAAVLFEQGAVARWYQLNGWTYPVQAEAVSGIGAVQQFFEALGLTAPPKVEISAKEIQLEGQVGEALRHTLEVKAQEKRPVWAHAASNQPWLEVSQVKLEGRTATIRLAVPEVPDRPGETLKARLTVTANGNQRFVVPVTLAIGGRGRTSTSRVVLEPVAVAGEPLTARPSSRLRRPATAAPVQALPAAVPVQAIPLEDGAPQAVAPLALVPPGKRGRAGWIHLLPVVLIFLGLLAVTIRDMFVGKEVLSSPSVGPEPEVVDPSPWIAVRFHDQGVPVMVGNTGLKPEGAGNAEGTPAVWQPSMRFGLVMLKENDPQHQSVFKRLTFDIEGLTNNTCVRLDGHEWIFGESPLKTEKGDVVWESAGHWQDREASLGQTREGEERVGKKSVWFYDQEKVAITQTVEIVPGAQSQRLDTCLVRYLIENQDSQPHQVGLRFLLDTFIGANDGVPFTIPGASQLCDTMKEFSRSEDVPDFLQALEKGDLTNPGTIAHVQLRLGKLLETPSRVTLGAWPNARLRTLDPRCQEGHTMWDVPVLPIKSLSPGDSCVTIYWNEKPLPAGAKREVGFTYGLGNVAGGEGHGKLGLTVGGSFAPGGEFTVTAYVSDPVPGQSVTLSMPEEFQLLEGSATQKVPPLPANASTHNSPVTWRGRGPAQEGQYTLRVESSTGVKQTQPITIRAQHIFD